MILLLDRTASVMLKQNLRIDMRNFVTIVVYVTDECSGGLVLLNERKNRISLFFLHCEHHAQSHVESPVHFQIRHVSLTLKPCEFWWD